MSMLSAVRRERAGARVERNGRPGGKVAGTRAAGARAIPFISLAPAL